MTWLAQRTIYRDSTDLLYVRKYGDTTEVAEPVLLTLKVQDQRTATISEPTLSLPGNQGQELLQALWDCGLRPNDGAGSGAEAQALRKHIAFAERMADGLLKVHV